MFEQARQELSTLRDVIRFAVSRFNESGVFFGHGTDNAWDEAVYLALHCLHLPPDTLDPYLDAKLTHQERHEVLSIIEKRISERLPAAYLTREAWLAEHRFYVDERVIVPRSHIAELLDEQLSPWVKDPWAIHEALDLCTGSGCLAILAAIAFPEARIDAVDICQKALEVAEKNISDYALTSRITLIASDGFTNLGEKRYHLIIANPPYVCAKAMASLPEEYKREPAIALDGGENGLDFIHIILDKAGQYLCKDGFLVVEIGSNKEALEKAYPNTPFMWLTTKAGSSRVFMLRARDLP